MRLSTRFLLKNKSQSFNFLRFYSTGVSNQNSTQISNSSSILHQELIGDLSSKENNEIVENLDTVEVKSITEKKDNKNQSIQNLMQLFQFPSPLDINAQNKVENVFKSFMLKGEYDLGMTLFQRYYRFFPETEFEKRTRLLKELNFVKDVMFDKVPEGQSKQQRRKELAGSLNLGSGRYGRLRTLEYSNLQSIFPLTLDIFQYAILFGLKNPVAAKKLMSNGKVYFGDMLENHIGTQSNFVKVLFKTGEYNLAFNILNRILNHNVVDFESLSPRIIKHLGEDFIDTLISLLFGSTINFKNQSEFVKNVQLLLNFVLEHEGLIISIPRERVVLATKYLEFISSGSVDELVKFVNDHPFIFDEDSTNVNPILNSRREMKYFLSSIIHNTPQDKLEFIKKRNSSLYSVAFQTDRNKNVSEFNTEISSTTIYQRHSVSDILKSRGVDIYHPMFKSRTRPIEKGTKRQRAKLRAKIYKQKIASGEIQVATKKENEEKNQNKTKDSKNTKDKNKYNKDKKDNKEKK